MLHQSRFAIGSYPYFRYPLELFLDTASHLGYSFVELWAASPHLFPHALDEVERKRIRGMIKSKGLNVCCITPEQVFYPYNLAHKDEKLRRLSIEHFIDCIDLAHELESPNVLVTAGCGYFHEPLQVMQERSFESVLELSMYAYKVGVSLLYETLTPLSSNIVNTPEQLHEMLLRLPDNVGAIADLGQIAYMKQDLGDYIRLFGSRLRHVHLHDSGEAIHMALGDGWLDITEQIQRLEHSGYKGLYSLEVNDIRYRLDPVKCDEQNLAWLKAHVLQ